jgi:hypothetical protein
LVVALCFDAWLDVPCVCGADQIPSVKLCAPEHSKGARRVRDTRSDTISIRLQRRC